MSQFSKFLYTPISSGWTELWTKSLRKKTQGEEIGKCFATNSHPLYLRIATNLRLLRRRKFKDFLLFCNVGPPRMKIDVSRIRQFFCTNFLAKILSSIKCVWFLLSPDFFNIVPPRIKIDLSKIRQFFCANFLAKISSRIKPAWFLFRQNILLYTISQSKIGQVLPSSISTHGGSTKLRNLILFLHSKKRENISTDRDLLPSLSVALE